MHIFSDKRCRRTGAYFLFFFLVIALLRSPQQVFADPTSGTISGDNVFVRNEPGIDGTTMLVAVDSGQKVNIIGQTTVDGKTWYQVTCTVGDTSYTGWTYGMYVTVNDSDTTASAGGTGNSSAGTGTSSTGTGSNSTGSSSTGSSSSGTGNSSAGGTPSGTDTSSSNNAGAQEPAESEEPEGAVKEFTVNGYVLHPADTIPEAIIPVGFSEDTITIDDAEYPCLSFSDGEMKFLYLLEEGETSGQLYLYDELRDAVYPFLQLESESGYLIAALPGGQQLLGSFFQDSGTYRFDTTVNAYPRYVFSSAEEAAEDTADEQQTQQERDYAKLEAAYNKLQQRDSQMLYIGFGIIGVLLLVIIVLIATRGKAKPADEFEDEDDWDKEAWEAEEEPVEEEIVEEEPIEEETVAEEEEIPEEEELPAIEIPAEAETVTVPELSAIDIAAVAEEAPEVEEAVPEVEVAPAEEEIPEEEELPADEITAEEVPAVEIPAEAETVTAPELPAEDDEDDDLVFIDL